MPDSFLESLDLFKDAFPGRIDQIVKSKEGGRKIAEEYLPRNLCPLIKSSFGSVTAFLRNL